MQNETRNESITTGNILDSTDRVIVIPVNCMGVMGKGLALQFKIRYPLGYYQYLSICKRGLLKNDTTSFVALPRKSDEETRYAALLPTKGHWREKSNIDTMRKAIISLFKKCDISIKNTTVSIPKIGCGLGGLNWDDVFPIIREIAAQYPSIRVRYYL